MASGAVLNEAALLDEILDPFAQCLVAGSLDRVIEFTPSESVVRRLEELAERANEGLLTAEERSLYEAVIRASDFITIIQHKARRLAHTART